MALGMASASRPRPSSLRRTDRREMFLVIFPHLFLLFLKKNQRPLSLRRTDRQALKILFSLPIFFFIFPFKSFFPCGFHPFTPCFFVLFFRGRRCFLRFLRTGRRAHHSFRAFFSSFAASIFCIDTFCMTNVNAIFYSPLNKN